MKTTKSTTSPPNNFLQKLRDSLGINSDELAVRLGIKFTTLYRWETGKTETPMLSLIQVKRLAKELRAAGMDIEDLPDSFINSGNDNDESPTRKTKNKISPTNS